MWYLRRIEDTVYLKMSLTAFTHPISNVSRCPMPQLFARRPRKWNQSEQLMPHFSPVPVSKKVIEIKQPFRRRITETSNRLLKLTSAASLLCVIDCTILPFVTLALPFLGLGATSKQARILHDVGHNLALWFVLPGKSGWLINLNIFVWYLIYYRIDCNGLKHLIIFALI